MKSVPLRGSGWVDLPVKKPTRYRGVVLTHIRRSKDSIQIWLTTITTKSQSRFYSLARLVMPSARVKSTCRCRPGRPLALFLPKCWKSFPRLRRFGRSLLFAVNQEYAALDSNREVSDGDELAVFPPVSGGAAKSFDSGQPPTSKLKMRAPRPPQRRSQMTSSN